MGGEILNYYDCIVYGNDIYGLIVAVYLARKMRKVLVIQDSSKTIDDFEEIKITDPENNKYHFEYNPKGMVCGLDKNGLTYEYLDNLGLIDEIKATKIIEDVVVNSDNTLRKRIHNFTQFRVYLVRHYPKSRNRIHRFFDDLERHYQNYTEQYINMLKNTSYTLTSLMIEWGDYSLRQLLDKYFDNDDLKQEFLMNDFINGLNCEEINSYNFFSNYFVGIHSGFYMLENSEDDLRKMLIKKLTIISPDSIIKTRVKEFTMDEDGKIKSIVDKDDNEYSSKYFFIDSNPLKFYPNYFDGKEEDIEIIRSYYPNLDQKQFINTLYLAINQNPKNVGLEDILYYFKNNSESPVKIIKLLNYSLFKNEDKRRKKGMICVDFTYEDASRFSQDDILSRVYEAFPKLKKNIVGIKQGKPRPHFTMLSDASVRKNLSINELIDIEEFGHIQVFDNLYLGSKYLRPEAGIYGVFNQSLIFGDTIEDRLYFGEDDGVFHYLNNEEIMMMIRHNYDYKIFGNQEIHINFHIGKNTYFIRTKGKNIVIHQGRYSQADLAIYTTNDTLSNLLLKKITFNEVMNEGSLKFRGDLDLLLKVVDAFNLDDYQEYNPLDYKKSKYKDMGAKILFAYFGIYFGTCLFSNYVNGIWIYPFALVLGTLVAYFKYKSYEELNWFDIFINAVFLIGLILSISWNAYNTFHFDDHLLGLMALALMVSVFTDRPVVYNYTKFDNNVDYRNSILFKIISNGLTFVWGFLLLAILVGTYITGEQYVSVLYNFYFVGIFFMYFYPVIYVNTNIKK